MRKSGAEAWLILMAAATAAAAPSNADMSRCAVISAPDSRLACYDALAHRPADKVPSVAAKGTPAPVSAAAPATATSTAPATSTATTTQAPVTAAAIAADPKNFGLSPAQQHTTELGPKSITAHISILSSDQTGRTLMVLDSGETWSVADSDGWLATGQEVRIKKVSMGSYLMLIPSNHSYHVHRLK
jgi:hypothetical protein